DPPLRVRILLSVVEHGGLRRVHRRRRLSHLTPTRDDHSMTEAKSGAKPDAKPDALLPVAEVSGLQPGYAAPSCRSDGEVASALFAPADYSLWLLTARLEAGAVIEWRAAHGDEAVYVTSGSLTVEGHECGAGGSVIVESGVAAVARAEVPTEVVHVGP